MKKVRREYRDGHPLDVRDVHCEAMNCDFGDMDWSPRGHKCYIVRLLVETVIIRSEVEEKKDAKSVVGSDVDGRKTVSEWVRSDSENMEKMQFLCGKLNVIKNIYFSLINSWWWRLSNRDENLRSLKLSFGSTLRASGLSLMFFNGAENLRSLNFPSGVRSGLSFDANCWDGN